MPLLPRRAEPSRLAGKDGRADESRARAPSTGVMGPDLMARPAGGRSPWALQVLEISAGRICGFHAFLDTDLLFPVFGPPAHLPA